MTIEIHELDITDGLNKTLYDELKAENKKLSSKVLQLEKTLDKIYEVRHIKGVSDSIEMFYNNLKEQIKEVK